MSRRRPGLKIEVASASQPPIQALEPPRNLDTRATITIDDRTFELLADDLEKISDLGRGAYGFVEKMRHRKTGTVMAVKRITATVNTQEQVRNVQWRSMNHPKKFKMDRECTLFCFHPTFRFEFVWINSKKVRVFAMFQFHLIGTKVLGTKWNLKCTFFKDLGFFG
jgi:hypothetical protein